MSDTKKVLVAEKLAPEGVKMLEDAGFDVDLGKDWTPEEFMARIGDYQGLLIRSATKVHGRVIDAAPPVPRSSAAPASASTTSTSTPPASAASSSSTRGPATC